MVQIVISYERNRQSLSASCKAQVASNVGNGQEQKYKEQKYGSRKREGWGGQAMKRLQNYWEEWHLKRMLHFSQSWQSSIDSIHFIGTVFQQRGD